MSRLELSAEGMMREFCDLLIQDKFMNLCNYLRPIRLVLTTLSRGLMRNYFLAVVFVLLTPTLAQNQAMNAPSEPQISVAVRGEIRVSPDRATIQVSVQTRAAMAAAAANENATRQAVVIQALRALGLGTDQISTINYNVYPEQRYEPNKDPVVTGYSVTNTISIEVRKLNEVGPVIDASLKNGANVVTSLQFYASNTEEARRTTIASAVQKARLDADAAARAAGGTIGGLLEVNIGAYYAPPPRPIVMLRAVATADQAPTPISPGDQTLSVDVTTRWRFNAK